MEQSQQSTSAEPDLAPIKSIVQAIIRELEKFEWFQKSSQQKQIEARITSYLDLKWFAADKSPGQQAEITAVLFQHEAIQGGLGRTNPPGRFTMMPLSKSTIPMPSKVPDEEK